MSIAIKDMVGTELIPFGPDFMTFCVLNDFLLIGGIIVGGIVIASILRLRDKSVDTLFVLSLCLADMTFNVYQLIFNGITCTDGGWKTGWLGCLIANDIVITCLGLSIFSILLITLNRYLLIIWKKRITRIQALVMIAIIWLGLPLIMVLSALVEVYSFDAIALQPSHSVMNLF